MAQKDENIQIQKLKGDSNTFAQVKFFFKFKSPPFLSLPTIIAYIKYNGNKALLL